MSSVHVGSPHRHRVVTAVGLPVVLVLLAACGSTAQVRSGVGGVVGGASDDGGLSAPIEPAEAPLTTSGAPTTGIQSGGEPAHGGPEAPGAQAGGVGGPIAAPTGPLAPVKVGVYIDEGFSRLAGSAGFSGDAVQTGDGRKQAQAIIADLNRYGGLAGHRVEPVFAVRDSQSDDSFALQEQQACSLWTEDHHVVAAVSALNTTDLLPRCLSSRGVPFVANSPMNYTEESFAAAPYFAEPAWINQTRMAPAYVDRLVAQGFFRSGAGPAGPVVGLLRFDAPQHARVAREGIGPALARHGLRLSEEAAIRQAGRTSENSGSLAAIQSAVLRFQSRGVTHVLALDYGGYFGLFFLPSAEKNQYRPRYGLTSYSAPYALQSLGIPEQQLRNVSGMGWIPGADVDPRNWPPETAGSKRCRAIAQRAGLPHGKTDSGTITSYCETLFFLKAVLDRAGTVQARGWLRGLEAMGTAYQSVFTFATRFGPGRHDGAAMVRDFRWSTGCSCFAYISPPVSIG